MFRIATWTILATLPWVVPGYALAGKNWTSMKFEQVPESSPVWLRLRVDTVALEAAVAARWFLIKSSDSLRTLPDGSRLQVSDLHLVRPTGTAEVTGQAWKSLHQGKVLLTFDFRDSHGTSGALDAWLGTEAIDRVFVFWDNTPAPSGSSRKPGSTNTLSPRAKASLILIGPIAGGLVGMMYGKMKGDGANSQPGMNATIFSFSGMAIGLWIGIQAAFAD